MKYNKGKHQRSWMTFGLSAMVALIGLQTFFSQKRPVQAKFHMEHAFGETI